jgi:hypothetical protein
MGGQMLGLDLSVALALVLSVASAALCVGYGLTHWSSDDDQDEEPPIGIPEPAETGVPKTEPDDA